MKIAIVCSNYFNIRRETANGTAIFDYSLITQLDKLRHQHDLEITAFASGNSLLPVKTISIDNDPSTASEGLIASGKNVLYEQTLLSKAFSMQDQFDLYHINIGDGDIALPFSPFVKKPMLITIHHILNTDYMRRFFAFWKDSPNIFFISASNAQRKLFPDLPYLETIYHGVDTSVFAFDPNGGKSIMWAGRAIPEKGLDSVVEVAQKVEQKAKLFGIIRKEYQEWLEEKVLKKVKATTVTFETGHDRFQLIKEFQTSKVFLFPVSYEESFGLVLIESMSCGTPVVAYANGSIPEIIQDGITGFIVNESDDDIRGDWIIKKTGVDGLQEAVERIYSMPENEYSTMRKASRQHIEKNFTIERMTEQYFQAYKYLIENTP